MKKIFEENGDLVLFIKSLICIFSVFCSLILLFDLGLSFGGLGTAKMDTSFIYFVFIINYQLFLLMISFLTLTILLPRWILLLIGGVITISPITFLNYQDGLGWPIYGVISLIGLAYIVSKFYEKNVNQGDFWLFKGLTVFLAGIDILITSELFNSLKLTALAEDFPHRVLVCLFTFTIIIGLILVILLLFESINKIYEYIIGFGLLFVSILFFFNQELTMLHPILTGSIALIFIAYVAFFQNEKYHNL